jgi:hypothetical protein
MSAQTDQSPAQRARTAILAEANTWRSENPDTKVLLVFRAPLTAIDLETNEVFIELQGDLVAKVENGIAAAEVYKSIYATFSMKRAERRVVLTPEEALAEARGER